MYIKQLIIQGFKSYKDQTVMEPFSPGTNVIVGRNGSGKSNFFAAIRFVLGDAYTQLSREERQALLHEGSGSAVMSAYVEIIFDNSDNRFQTGGKEVSLRRTITLKKDEYAVDKKVSNRNEVMSMLDTAGFSLKNSYYIVPQGRVTALTNMKESDRLKLLKEVAGTESYEARRSESLKIMTETNNKRGKIDELLDYIKKRMSELEEEKEELRGFQDKDRERRCLEYAYYHQQQTGFTDALEEIESTRQNFASSMGDSQRTFLEGEQMVAQMDAKLHELQQSLEILEMDRNVYEEDRRETAKVKAKAELKVKNLADSQSARDHAKRQHDADLKPVRGEIATKEKQLASIAPELAKRKEAEMKAKQTYDVTEAAHQRLLNKQSRGSQFKNRAQRDDWLAGEIEDLNMQLATQKANIMSADEEMQDTKRSIKSLENDISRVQQNLDGFFGNRDELADQLSQARDQLQRLDDERRTLRREEDKLQTVVANTRKERDRAQLTLNHSMDRATARGLNTIEQLKAEKDLPGAYGMLADLMEVSEAYRIPVEQTAGASLFHYVVDNEATGTILANALYQKHGGRVTFMPLAQLRPRKVNFPRANDAVALVSKINYDPMFDRAFQQVFGKTVVCPNLTVAAQYARSHNIDCITPEGDTSSKRGAMTGGYVDPGRSRLEAVRALTKWRSEYERLIKEVDELKRQIEGKDQEYTSARGEERKLEQRLRQLEEGHEPLRVEQRSKKEQLEREMTRLDSATRRRDTIDVDMRTFSTNIENYKAERSSDFKKALTAAEEQQLQALGNEVQRLQKELADASGRRREVENHKRILESDLRQNLRLKEDELASQVFETMSATAGGGGSYPEAQRELKKVQKRSDDVSKRLRKAEADIESQASKISEIQAQRADKERSQLEIAEAIEKRQKKLEKGLQRKALLTQSLADCAKNIRDLGVLPEEAFDKYERMDTAKISKRLKTVNETLKKFKHVNKKAFEQYASFTSQQEQLLKRRKELDSSQESIEELVAHLDRVKDESIERTFKQISKEFATIFERLVPAGHGRLIIQRKSDRRGQEEDDEEQRRSVENYTGVGISVSFNSKHMDEQQKVQQLSGGQKSLCALCLIFAIQQTDPSPMVVFDEVDANLDAQYRTAVASLLQSTSADAGTQFICTTFRPEIVHVADKCYGVTFTNKTSSIECVPTEAALNFVEGQKQ